MLRMIAVALTLAAIASPALADDTFVRAFIRATDNPTARVQKVLDGMSDFMPLAAMVKDGRIASPYDCLPEHRSICFDVLSGRAVEGGTIEEWGEWRDAIPPEDLPAFVESHVTEATQRGFNLLSNDELSLGN